MAGDPANDDDTRQISEEELRQKLEEHFRHQPVDEFLVQFLVSLSTLGYVKMGLTDETKDVRDLAQAQMAIDAFKGMLEAIQERLDSQEAQALAGALASMQITYVRAAGEGGAAVEEKEAPPEAEKAPPEAAAEGETQSKTEAQTEGDGHAPAEEEGSVGPGGKSGLND